MHAKKAMLQLKYIMLLVFINTVALITLILMHSWLANVLHSMTKLLFLMCFDVFSYAFSFLLVTER